MQRLASLPARTTFLQILEAGGITEAHKVRTHTAHERHSSRTREQQRNLSPATPKSMDVFGAADDAQCVRRGQGLGEHGLIGRLQLGTAVPYT
jgi:hypothetical protein